MSRASALHSIFLSLVVASTQSIAPAFASCIENSAGCPPHRVLAKAPVGSFLENIARAPDGAFLITDYTGKRIIRFTDQTGFETLSTVETHPLGIAIDTDGTTYFTGQDKSLFGGGGTMADANAVWKIPRGGKPELVVRSTEAQFLNGMLRLAPGRILIADSRGGVIWELITATGRLSKFLVDPLLDTNDAKSPTPAANGIKLRDGHIYVSNTVRSTFVRAKLDADLRPGKPEVFLENARADDFDFSPKGTLYFTTHRDKVLRLVAGKIEEFAGGQTGIVGNTALIWNAKGEGPYVIGDGGYVAQQWYKGPAATEATIVKFDAND